MMSKVHKASRIASYMGSMATVTQGAVTMVAIATTMLPGVETFGCPQTMAYQESINVSNSFIEGRGVPEPRTVSDDSKVKGRYVGVRDGSGHLRASFCLVQCLRLANRCLQLMQVANQQIDC